MAEEASSSYDTGTDSENESNEDAHRFSVNVWDLPSDTNTVNKSKILQNVHQSHSTGYIQQKQQHKSNTFQYTNPSPQPVINNYAHTPPPPQYQSNNNTQRTQFPHNSNQINQQLNNSNSQQYLQSTPKKAYPIQPSQTVSMPQQMAYVNHSNTNQYNNNNNSNGFNNNNSNRFNNQYLHNEQKYNSHMYSNSTPNVLQINTNKNYNQNNNAFTPPITQNNTQTFNQWQNRKKLMNNKNDMIKAENVKQQWLNSQKQNKNTKTGNNTGYNNDYLQNTLKSGYMNKEGGLVKSWKKRWFVLRINGIMSYYENNKMKKELSTLNCNNVKKVTKESWGKKKFGLKLSTKQRDWKFVCANGTERMEWYDAFRGIVMMKT